MEKNDSLYRIENLSKKFSQENILDQISLNIPHSLTIGILGNNGAGKSTLFQILTGNMDACTGKILFENN